MLEHVGAEGRLAPEMDSAFVRVLDGLHKIIMVAVVLIVVTLLMMMDTQAKT